MIEWSAVDWGAWATFATGVLVVGGAVFIGRRQLEIAERQVAVIARQTELQAQQISLAEQTLRHELFQRRFEVYQVLERAISRALEDEDFPEDMIRPVLDAVTRSRFLFRPEIQNELGNILGYWLGYWAFETAAKEDSEERLQLWGRLFKISNKLTDIFGDDMRIIPTHST